MLPKQFLINAHQGTIIHTGWSRKLCELVEPTSQRNIWRRYVPWCWWTLPKRWIKYMVSHKVHHIQQEMLQETLKDSTSLTEWRYHKGKGSLWRTRFQRSKGSGEQEGEWRKAGWLPERGGRVGGTRHKYWMWRSWQIMNCMMYYNNK